MAFQSAGLAVPSSRLDGFFNDIDMNNDGYISFEEWRYVYTPPSVSVLFFLNILCFCRLLAFGFCPGHMQPFKTWQMR